MKQTFVTVLLAGIIGASASAHEGHESPGALPLAPNGGKIAEAAHAGADQHHGKGEAEIFIEAKLEGTKLKLYAHALGPADQTVFKSLKPGANLSFVEVKMELPRTKKTTILKVAAKEGFWESELGSVAERRLLILATVMDGAEKKTARIQIER